MGFVNNDKNIEYRQTYSLKPLLTGITQCFHVENTWHEIHNTRRYGFEEQLMIGMF